MQAAYQSNNVAPLVVYVGDAAGAIDPSGWHGAGLGIESGFNLAQTIQQARLMHDRQVEFSPDVIAKPGKEEDTVMSIDNMKMHLLDFESIRERRLRKIQLLSSLSSRVSHVESEVRLHYFDNFKLVLITLCFVLYGFRVCVESESFALVQCQAS